MSTGMFVLGLMVGANLGLTLALYGHMRQLTGVMKALGAALMALGTTVTTFTSALETLGNHIEELKRLQAARNDGRLH